MTEMSMNKAIHGAFRRDLTRLTGALETIRPGDSERAGRLGEAWTQLSDQLTEHHTGEHTIAWPALESVGVGRDLLAQMDDEHEVMASAVRDLDDAMRTLAQDASQAHAESALAAAKHLQSVTLRHLDHEETELEPVYLANRDTPEIKAMGKQFAKVGPVRGGQFFAWLADGATPDELAAIKHSIPGPVFTIISGIFGRDYRKRIATVWAS
jgi:hemerythrin-like domain-containing protein